MINIIHQNEKRITKCQDIEICKFDNVYHICVNQNKTLRDFLSYKNYTCISLGFFKNKDDVMLVMKALFEAIDSGERIFQIPIDSKFHINSLCAAYEVSIDEYNKKDDYHVDA